MCMCLFLKKKNGNVKECSKGIGLEIIFRNILWKNDKTINFVDIFYIFHKNYVNFPNMVY